MTAYADMSPYTYYAGEVVPDVLNVGWLEGAPEEPLPSEEAARLGRLILESLPVTKVAQTRGFHVCKICGDPRWNLPCEVGGKEFVLGSAEAWFPGVGDIVYAAPTLIVHYIREHGYRPPPQFVAAVETLAATHPRPDIAALFAVRIAGAVRSGRGA